MRMRSELVKESNKIQSEIAITSIAMATRFGLAFEDLGMERL